MTTLSGSFVGKARLQTTVTLTDLANHELNLVEITGQQESADPNWNDATVTYWGIGDLQAGSGTQRGYYVNARADGDRDWGTFEGKITAEASQVTLEGTWKLTGGSGKFKGATGGGSYKGSMNSPVEVKMEYKGEYQLAATKAQGG